MMMMMMVMVIWFVNIQHDRDHGLASYTAWAQHCGLLKKGAGWAELASLVRFQLFYSFLKSVISLRLATMTN